MIRTKPTTKRKNNKKASLRRRSNNRLSRIFSIKNWWVMLVFIALLSLAGAFGYRKIFPSNTGAAALNGRDEAIQFYMLNADRGSHGRPLFTPSACLTNAARSWAKQLAAYNNLKHSVLSSLINPNCGAGWTYLAENIGVANDPCRADGSDTCSQKVFNGFMNSPGHLANIRDARFNLVGVGAYRDGRGKLWVVQEFAQCNGCGGAWTAPPTSVPPLAPGRRYDKGYVLSGFGDIYHVVEPQVSNDPAWSWQIARGLRVSPQANNGYLLDGYGALHSWSATGYPPAPSINSGVYWKGVDIARDFWITDWGKRSGYVLDGYGGIHAFGGAPAVRGASYWKNWDIARRIVMRSDNTGGYVLDGWGGIHPFAVGNNPIPPKATGASYWKNWDIARAIVLNPQNTGGYVLDGWGGIHPFGLGGRAAPAKPTGAPYWKSWDIARDIEITDWNKRQGYVLSGEGGVHALSGAPKRSIGVQWF